MLEQRSEKIKQLQKSNQEIIVAKNEVSKNPQSTENLYDAFDKNAQSTLSYLSHIGYDELGQDTLDHVITAINREKR